MRPLVLLLATLLAAAPAAPPDQSEVPLVVESVTVDGTSWWTVQGRGVALERVLLSLARKSGRRLEGLRVADREKPLTVDLRRRPLEQVLEYALGSVGLRYELDDFRLTIGPDLGPSATRDELLDAAAAAWIHATTRFPTNELAPGARLAQGELAEVRGLYSAANAYYQTLIETFPTSEAAGEALMRSGRIDKRLGNWSEASLQFRELADSPDHVEFHAQARLELARSLIELGNAESARFLLDTLDSEFPTVDRVQLTERLLVRAQALNALGRYLEALQLLDRSARQLDQLAGHDVLRVRAKSLEGVGMPGDAGRAWLLYAKDATGDERTKALEEAARLALAAGDELSVLFVHQEAGSDGSARLDATWHEARRRLGLEEPGTATTEDEVADAEELLKEGELDRASDRFHQLYAARATLADPLSARVCAGWAACIEAKGELAEAIDVLREARAGFDSLDCRRRLDLAAARLFEKHGRFDLSVDAYHGVYADEAVEASAPSGGDGR